MRGYGIYPIGIVESEILDPAPPERFRGRNARIVVDEAYLEALEGISKGERILVLFVFHRSHGFSMKVHPKGDLNRPLRGLFSTCSPMRPNPVGATAVEVVSVDGRVITVKGIDAVDGTPVIDIKPFHLDGTGDQQ